MVDQLEVRSWYLKFFLCWGPGFGRREGGVRRALFLANENRLDWLWERAWFQLYWRQAYCVNAIPPTTTTLSSIYSLWHVFSNITFCCALFLSFFFKHFFFPIPFFTWELNGRRAAHGSCNHAHHFETFIFVVREKNWLQRVKISLTKSIFKRVVWHAEHARVHAAESHVIIIISMTSGPFYNFNSRL